MVNVGRRATTIEGGATMIVIKGGRRKEQTLVTDSLTTEQLLHLHERHFARLDARSKERIIDGARMRGWDRSWGLDGLAA
jgi:hypothetical protein